MKPIPSTRRRIRGLELSLVALLAVTTTGCGTTRSSTMYVGGQSGHEDLLLTPTLMVLAAPLYLLGLTMPEDPPILKTGTPQEIEAVAVADAQADIRAKRPRVALTGGFAAEPVGIPEEHHHLIKDLKRVPLPAGCTAQLLSEAGIYAAAYNREMLPYLLSQQTQ